jgi:predicted Ser/Thr protein kinase
MSREIFGIDVKDLVFIGKGVEGKVYLTPDKKVLKIYRRADRCRSEYKIFKKMENNKYFPNVIECKGRYMLREYVEGLPIRDYINKNGLSEKLALNLIKIAEEFYKFNNIKFDGLNKHVFIKDDDTIKVIDPRRRNYKFYESLMRSLEIVGVLEQFTTLLKEKEPKLASIWLKK